MSQSSTVEPDSHFIDRNAMRIVLVTALAALGMSACQEEAPTASEDASEVADGQTVPSRSSVHHLLVHQVAAALAENPGLREKIAQDMKASPMAEGKLFLSDYLRNDGSRLLTAAANEGGTLTLVSGPGAETDDRQERLTVERRADSILSLVDHATGGVEMYVPVDEHRESWDGGEDLIVATMVGDDQSAEPYGVNLDGAEVQLDRETPPAQPTLVVVPAEGFTREGKPRMLALKPATMPNFNDDLPTNPPGDGGGGDGVNCNLGTAGGARGIGIQEKIQCIEYHDKNEPWPSGNPEFEILLSGTNDVDPQDELNKRIEIPSYVWEGADTGEAVEYEQSLILWDADWGRRIRVQCFEDDTSNSGTFNLSGSTTATVETTWGEPGTSVSFQGSFSMNVSSPDEDDNCNNGYILQRTSEGDLIQIPDGNGSSNHDYDGTSDLKWFGAGEDITV